MAKFDPFLSLDWARVEGVDIKRNFRFSMRPIHQNMHKFCFDINGRFEST